MKWEVKNGMMSEEEVRAYAKIISKKNNNVPVKDLILTIGKDDKGEYVDVTYTLETIPFERVRRITGYLVGTLDRFNNGKRAEEHDRVKHTT